MAAVRINLALSAEKNDDFQMICRAFTGHPAFEGHIVNKSLLDLLLKAQNGLPGQLIIPDLIVAFYRNRFTDLKIVAELRKMPLFQWTPIYIIVNEDITHTRTHFFRVGVSAVIPFYHGNDIRSIADEIIENHIKQTNVSDKQAPAKIPHHEK